MTRVEFFDHEGRITGFCCSGHSGYAEAGSDIVCAAVSTAVKLAECTINDVLGEHAKTRVNEDEARITLTLPAACESEEAVQAVLSGMMLTLCSLRDDYPDYIEVLELKHDIIKITLPPNKRRRAAPPKNGRDSESKRLGAKRADGQFVLAGNILVRQRGTHIHPATTLVSARTIRCSL